MRQIETNPKKTQECRDIYIEPQLVINKNRAPILLIGISVKKDEARKRKSFSWMVSSLALMASKRPLLQHQKLSSHSEITRIIIREYSLFNKVNVQCFLIWHSIYLLCFGAALYICCCPYQFL